MTKKELTVLRSLKDRAMNEYMSYVMKNENVPTDVLERAVVYCEIFRKLELDVIE